MFVKLISAGFHGKIRNICISTIFDENKKLLKAGKKIPSFFSTKLALKGNVLHEMQHPFLHV